MWTKYLKSTTFDLIRPMKNKKCTFLKHSVGHVSYIADARTVLLVAAINADQIVNDVTLELYM